eukprot:scaffold14282_cov99-Isochrysis_galbana.AAC.2
MAGGGEPGRLPASGPSTKAPRSATCCAARTRLAPSGDPLEPRKEIAWECSAQHQAPCRLPCTKRTSAEPAGTPAAAGWRSHSISRPVVSRTADRSSGGRAWAGSAIGSAATQSAIAGAGRGLAGDKFSFLPVAGGCDGWA